ncbi:DUF2268 domain-containing putative Zn-dependent protease [Bacillus sp. SS-TM]
MLLAHEYHHICRLHQIETKETASSFERYAVHGALLFSYSYVGGIR